MISELKLNSIPVTRADTVDELRDALNRVIGLLTQHFDRVAAVDTAFSKPGTATSPWITPTDSPPSTAAASWTTVDLSKDSPPGDAIGAWLRWSLLNNSGGAATLSWRTGSGATAQEAGIAATATRDSLSFPVWFNTAKSIDLLTDVNLAASTLRVMAWIR